MGRGHRTRLFACLAGILAAPWLASVAAAARAPSSAAPASEPAVTNLAATALRCGEGGACHEGRQAALGVLIAFGCLAGIVFIVRRAQRPASLHLVSLLVALDASGDAIRGRLTQLARRAQRDSPDGLRHWVQRACTVLLEHRDAWTHAGMRGPIRLDSARAFARLRSELGARDAVHRGAYPGTPGYTVIALVLATRDPPPPLLAPGAQQLDEFLRLLARVRLQAFDVLWLPGQDRRMTLRELIEHYPELFPLDAQLSRANAG